MLIGKNKRCFNYCLLAMVMPIIILTGCGASYIKNNKAEKITLEKPLDSDVNYQFHYTIINSKDPLHVIKKPKINSVKKSEEYQFLKKNYIDWQTYLRETIMNPLFNNNKLYLNETFRLEKADYYIDFDITTETNIDNSGLLYPFALFLPIPIFNDTMYYYLVVTVYDRKPVAGVKPIATYKYRRTEESVYGSFLFGIGASIPVLLTGNLPMLNSNVEKKSMTVNYEIAIKDMLTEFLYELRMGKKGYCR